MEQKLNNEGQEVGQKMEVSIPEEVKKDLEIGLRKFFERLKKSPPDAIILPLRSALLPYEAVKGYAAQHQIGLPPDFTVEAGRKISDQYRNEREPADDLYVSIMTEESMREYFQWLDSDDNKTVKKAVGELKQKITLSPDLISKIQSGESIRIEIWDDAVFQGTTLLLTAPYVVAKAFSELGVAEIEVIDNPSIKDQEFTKKILGFFGEEKRQGKGKLSLSLGYFLGNRFGDKPEDVYTNDWRGPIINESFAQVLGHLEGKDNKLKVQLLLSELMRGSSSGEDLDWEEVVKMGDLITQRRLGQEKEIGGENPALILKRFYSEEDLLNINSKIKEALKEIGGALTLSSSEGK